MKTSTPITLTELNVIHARWMALSLDAPEATKQEVFQLMQRVPRYHISRMSRYPYNEFNVYVHGMPYSARPLTWEAATEVAQRLNIRTDIYWDGLSTPLGEWCSSAGF